MYTEESLKAQTVKELRELCKDLNLVTTGVEQVLVDRILAHQAEEQAKADAVATGASSESEQPSGEENKEGEEIAKEGESENGTEGSGSSESTDDASALIIDSSVDSSVSGDESLSPAVSSADSSTNPLSPQPPSLHGAEGEPESTVDTSNSLFLYKPKNGQDLMLGGGVPACGLIVRGGNERLDMYEGAYLIKTELTEEEAAAHGEEQVALAAAAVAAKSE